MIMVEMLNLKLSLKLWWSHAQDLSRIRISNDQRVVWAANLLNYYVVT